MMQNILNRNSKWVIFFKSTVTCYTYIFDQPGGIYDASMQGCCWKIDAIFMLDRRVLRTTLTAKALERLLGWI